MFANQRNLNLILCIIWIEHFLKVAFNSELRDSWFPSVMEHICVIGSTLSYTLIWVLRQLNFAVWESFSEHFLHPLDSAGPANYHDLWNIVDSFTLGLESSQDFLERLSKFSLEGLSEHMLVKFCASDIGAEAIIELLFVFLTVRTLTKTFYIEVGLVNAITCELCLGEYCFLSKEWEKRFLSSSFKLISRLWVLSFKLVHGVFN